MASRNSEKIPYGEIEKIVENIITSDNLVHSVMASMSNPLFTTLKQSPNRHNLAVALSQIEQAMRESLRMKKVESDLIKATTSRPVYGWALWRGQWYRARLISSNARGVRVRWSDNSVGNSTKFTPHDPHAMVA